MVVPKLNYQFSLKFKKINIINAPKDRQKESDMYSTIYCSKVIFLYMLNKVIKILRDPIYL